MTTHSSADRYNVSAFDSPDMVRKYEHLAGLTSGEVRLFEHFIDPGAHLLDLGVGTGRTTSFLSRHASTYVGIDIAPRMIFRCRQRFPTISALIADVARLPFAAGRFDAAIFSFNGLDYLHPESRRQTALSELARVLRPSGILIFSSHNARVLVRPISLQGKDLSGGLRLVLVRMYQSLRLSGRMLTSSAFWRGCGYVPDTDRKLVTYHATPARVRRSLARAGLRLELVTPAEPPGDVSTGGTLSWTIPAYYYVARRLD